MAVSYASKTGYYGMRVQETLEQVLHGDEGKPMQLPKPKRSATTEAASITRAHLLDASKKFTNLERALLNYRDSGGTLPETAAGDGPSASGQDETFARIERHHEAMQEQSAFEEAKKSMSRQNEQQTKEARAGYLRAAYGANRMDPMIEAHADQLDEAGVGHYLPELKSEPVRSAWKAPPQQWTAAGYVQAPEFPTFEALNRGEIHVRQAHPLTKAQNMTFERVRDLAVPSWSS